MVACDDVWGRVDTFHFICKKQKRTSKTLKSKIIFLSAVGVSKLSKGLSRLSLEGEILFLKLGIFCQAR